MGLPLSKIIDRSRVIYALGPPGTEGVFGIYRSREVIICGSVFAASDANDCSAM